MVFYNSSTFVQRHHLRSGASTLAEAFVLVVVVVFLFLGNVRATIIPDRRRPGQPDRHLRRAASRWAISANTVSLLAMVLAIGIVVDDAIVVVENVERVMEEEPELTPQRGHQARRWAQITAPIIAISLVLLSVFVPIAFIPGVSGQLFRQFAVTISVAMIISAINALTLSPALCAASSCRHIPGRGAASWAASPAASTGCATATRAIVRAVACALAVHRRGADRRLRRRHRYGLVAASPPPASCRTKTRARSSSPCSCRMPPASTRTRGVVTQRVESHVERHPANPERLCPSSASRCSTTAPRATPPSSWRKAETVRGPAPAAGDKRPGRHRPHLRRRLSRSAPPWCCRSTCRRSSACPPPAASNTSSRTWKAATPRKWPA